MKALAEAITGGTRSAATCSTVREANVEVGSCSQTSGRNAGKENDMTSSSKHADETAAEPAAEADENDVDAHAAAGIDNGGDHGRKV
jgi:hypothetical protein